MTISSSEKPFAPAGSTRSLGDVLVDMGWITKEQLTSTIESESEEGRNLLETLRANNLVTEEELAMALSLHLNVPLIDLKRHRVQAEAIKLIPESTARKYGLVPLDTVGRHLVVVMEDPGDVDAVDDASAQANMGVQPTVGLPSEIQDAIDLNYRASEEIERHIHDFSPSFEGNAQIADFDDSDAVAQAAIVRALDLIISQAVRDRASDIHIEPQQNHVRIRYRIDGILRDIMTIPSNALNPVISRIKILAGADITERRKPQDGQFSVHVDGRDVDIRAATLETTHGETAVLRILDRSASLFDMTELGFSGNTLREFQNMLKSSYGMILVAGPTGSGKTTSLYASLNQLNSSEQSIMTIEDPIEYKFKDIKQIQVNEKAGLSFASALRSLMRLDPDIILVGEIRDGETAQTAVQAALTGHLVLSSIHANDAASVPFRLQNLGVEPYLISTVVHGILAQRMVRRTCPHCSAPYEPTPEELAAYERDMGHSGTIMYKGVGCNFCSNTGYLDRTGLFELLQFNEGMRDILQSGAGISEIRTRAISDGMTTMRLDGMQKVKQGITTPSEVLRQVTAGD